MKIKILTLNIWKGGMFLDKIISFIKKEDPDIIVMQEVRNGKDPKLEKSNRSFAVFKEELRYPYSVFSPAFLNVTSIGKIDEGNAIFSRFPIIQSKVAFFDKQYGEFDSENSKHFELIPGILQHTVIEHQSLKLNIFNAHGIWGFDGKDNEGRLKMSKIIVDEVKDKKNVILAGDFNASPHTQTIGNIEKHLYNVFKNELVSTFNTKHKLLPIYATTVVDMIFVSKHFKVVGHNMPGADVSDHMPLVCELEI